MAYNPKEALEALNKKYGVTLPKTQTSIPVTQQPKKAAESQSDKLAALNKKYGVPSVEEQMRATGYLTDTPVGNTLKTPRSARTSADLRKQLEDINSKIAKYQKKAEDEANNEWLASISHITFNDVKGTAEDAKKRREANEAVANNYIKMRDAVAAQLDEAVYGEYMELSKRPDFATKSQYNKATKKENSSDSSLYEAVTARKNEFAYDDILYDYINKNEEARGIVLANEARDKAKSGGFDKTKYSQMTADEVAVYNYLYSQSKEKADEFLKAMEKKLSTRQGAAEAARIDAEPNAVKRGVAKGIVAVQSGLDSSIQGLAQGMTDEVLPKSQLSYTGEAVKETTSGVGRFIYDSVELVSHMVPAILTSYAVSGAGGAFATTAQGLKKAKTAGQLASSLVTAVSAAGNSYAEQVEKGLTKQQSKTIAALIGASEGSLQYLLSGVGAMGGKLTNNIISNKIAGVGCGLARVGLKLVASGVSEAVEEVLQLYVEPAVIAAVTGDAYDAPTRAEVIYTALLSAVSAGLFEGGAIVADETNTRRAGNIVLATDSVQAVIDDAAASDNPAMRRLADKLTKRLEEGKKITAYDLGRIVAESANPDTPIQAPEETAETQTETVETPAPTAEISPAVGETLSPTQAPERQTTPLQTETRTTVAEDGTTKVELPKVINREEQTRAAQKTNDPYAGVPEYSPSGLKYTELERSGIAAGVSKDVIESAKRISAITKRRVLFYDGDKMTGDWARANGAYDNNTIYVNSRSANPVAQIIAHEMTHSIEGVESYRGLREYVLKHMTESGSDLDAMRAAKRKRYGRADAAFDVDGEIVAEFVEKNLLTNEKEIRQMAREQPGVIRSIINWFNSKIANLTGARFAKERDFLVRARDMYSKALTEAQKRTNREAFEDASAEQESGAMQSKPTPESAPTSQKLDQSAPSAQSVAEEIKSNGSASFSLRTWSEQGRAALEAYLAIQEANGELSHKDCVDLIERLDDIYDVCQEFKSKYAVFSNWSDAEVVTDENGNPVMSVIVPNGDYPLNIDFSTICKKRKTLNNVLNALVKDGTLAKAKLGGVQIAKINTLLRNEGFEVACALCFVDSKRYGIDRWASSFANKWNGLIDSLGIDTTTRSHAGKGGAEVHNEADINWKHIDSILASEEGKSQHTELYKMAKLIKENPAQRQRLDKSDFMSSKGLDAVKTQNAELYRLLNQHGGVNKPKIAHSETQYISQIVNDTRFTPERARKVGGVRIQSFSDYIGAMFFDYVQMVGDLEAKKLPAHAYTKEQHFVKLFGMCGIKINMSLVPSGTGLDADGNYTWSNESFDFDTAVELQADPRYDKNVGTICVGVNDKHIRTLLADERIRMVIPYHKSGINKRVATEAGISGWTDYTKEQSTRKQNDKGEWQKLTSKNFDFYADLDKTNDPRKTAENYVRWCEEKGYKPKFDKFAYETIDGVPVVGSNGKKVDSNYYKLLIDFAVYDSNGDYTPQQAVKLELPADYTTVLQESLDQAQIADDKTTNELSGVTEKVKREILKISEPKFSISEDEAEEPRSFASFPKKSQKAIKRVESRALSDFSNLLGVPYVADRDSLRDIAREITDTYLESGAVLSNKADELFETAYTKSIAINKEFYNAHKNVKDYLRKTPVVLREEYRSEMRDYDKFRNEAKEVLNLTQAATRGIDLVYADLVEMAPELFPERITNPAKQLQKMYSVADSIRRAERALERNKSSDAESFKEWARYVFRANVGGYTSDLNLAKRYADSKSKKPEKAALSDEEVLALYDKLKPLKRELEKVKKKNLLTDEDKKQVDRLVRGDILLKHLDPETDNVRGITEVYEAALKYEEVAAQLREYKRNVKAAKIAAAQEIVGTTTDWEDRKTGIGYSRETAERNSFKVIKDPKKAKALNDAYFKPVHDHEKDAIDFKNKYRDRVRSFNLSRKVEKGNTVSESHAVQLLGEAEDNVKYLKEAQRRSRGKDVSSLQRDGKTLADWEAVIENLWITNPNLDKDKITKAVEEFRTIYDELFKFMNEVRVRNGYEPVSYRRGYFPHFQANEDGLLAAFGKALGISTDVVALPTSINGLTHMFKPGIKWFGNALERVGYDTTYDAVQGFDKYIEGVADVIYHTDDIQNLRALASYIRYASGDDGLREQADAIRANPELDEETKEAKIKELYDEGRFALNKYVVWLEEYTNLLAGKKSRNDRQLEDALNRQIYNAAKNLESRVAANMISLNVPSWLTNFIPLTQASALVSTSSLLKGMGATLKAYKSDDGIVSRSTFLTNRRGSDPLVQTWAQKTSATLGKGMEIIDTFTADSIVRARYYDNIKKGLSEDAAMSEADSFAASVMADRSKGSTPTLFQQKNPVTKLFTQFQLEVNNQLSYLLKDIPRENREKGLAALAMSLLKFMVGAWLYNEVYEIVIGRRPALDVLGILNDTVGDITGYELPNLVKLGAGAISGELPSFETEKGKVGANLVNNILEELPFTTILNLAGVNIDSGRYPVASALPDVTKIAKAMSKGVPGNKRAQTLVKELGKPAAYILPPFGGGQIKKLVEAIATVSRGGSYTIDNEGNKILQYPVYRDTTYETLLATMGAAIFGKTTLKTGQEWVESGFKSLSAKDTAVYQALVELGENEKKSYQFIKDIKAVEGTEDVSKADLKRKFLAESDLSDAAKSTIYYSMLATDKELEILTPLLGDDEKMVEAVNAMLNVHTTGGSSAKMLDIATEAGVSYDVAAKLANELAKLEPQTGKKSVTGLQKWRVAVDLAADEKEASALLKATMSDSQYERYENAVKQTKISSTMYIKGLELLSTYGSNPSNDEVTAAIQDMASNKATLPAVGKASGNLTDEQRAILWQMWTGSTSVKNNPWASKNDKAMKAAEAVATENGK